MLDMTSEGQGSFCADESDVGQGRGLNEDYDYQ